MVNASEITWKDVGAQALKDLGGQGSLTQINEKVAGHAKCETNPTWRDTIRRVVREYKIFVPLDPTKKTGIYRLAEMAALPSATADKSPDREQAMLLSLGSIFNYGTIAPSYDCTKRKFAGKSLANYASLRVQGRVKESIHQFKLEHIDAVWLAEEGDTFFPRYAFEVENNQNISAAIVRLLQIPSSLSTKLFVVAPGEPDEKRFNKHLSAAGVRNQAERFHYLPYEFVGKLYSSGKEFDPLRRQFGFEYF